MGFSWQTLYSLFFAPVRGDRPAERLDSFYERQAADYDVTRRNLLPGRRRFFESFSAFGSGVWVDFGCGSAECLVHARPNLERFSEVHLVDACRPMLEQARSRAKRLAPESASVTLSNICDFGTGDMADLVTFSYSLSMIEDWEASLEKALQLLRPGGCLAILDFLPPFRMRSVTNVRSRLFQQAWMDWMKWRRLIYAHDPEAFLRSRLEAFKVTEETRRFPWTPGFRLAYMVLSGSKPKRPQ